MQEGYQKKCSWIAELSPYEEELLESLRNAQLDQDTIYNKSNTNDYEQKIKNTTIFAIFFNKEKPGKILE